jgi:protein-L-isoaspartate(D-aspartate) O-methyltransferase
VKAKGVLLAAVLALALLIVYHMNTRGVETSTSRESVTVNLSTRCGGQPLVEDARFTEERGRMVEEQLRGRDIRDANILAVMSEVPRQEFMPGYIRGLAYADGPQPIGYGQTISQPYIVALMTQALRLNRTDRVLEVGTGSGYQAAVLAGLVDEVYTVEIIPELAVRADETLDSLGYCNVKVRNADGYFGWSEHAPYDAIMITAAVDHVPHPLVEQLSDGGRLILPLGSTRYYQTLTLVEKKGGELKTRYITDVVFVPMTGEALKHPGTPAEPVGM